MTLFSGSKTFGAFFFIALILLYASCKVSTNIAPNFTDAEREWISNRNKITLAVDDTYAPLNFRDVSGEISGLNIDMVKLIEKKIGVAIEFEGSIWNVALNKAMNHEVDGIINASPLEERKVALQFTDEILRDPWALVCHKSNEDVNSFSDLVGKTIAVKKNGRQAQILKMKVPEVVIVEVNTLTEAIKLISQHKADGVFDDLAPLYHIISTSNFNNIEIAFIELSDGGSRIGLRNDDQLMLSIFNKAIATISSSEKLAIQNKWIQVTPEKDYKKYYVIIGLLILSVLLFVFWSYSLGLVVKRKTYELKKELVQRQFAEKELIRAKEKAEESDRLKSAFLANMSHEIRTPLNAIIGFSSLLVDDELSKIERINFNEMISSSGDSLLNLINDIIDISKIEAGRIETKFSTFALGSVCNELDSIFSMEIERVNKDKPSDISFKVNVDDPISNLEVCYDKKRLIQILTILISNAIKFTSNGFVEVGFTTSNGSDDILVYVKDTGVGIDKENQEVIFNRFRKLEDDTNIYRGAGLGLSIAKQLVVLLKGDIWVESEVNEGSIFYFTIPAQSQSVQSEKNNLPS